jgi:hypothetical protein
VDTATQLRHVEADAEELARLSADLPLHDLVTPLDLDRHRREFVAAWQDGRRYDPAFQYADIDPAAATALATLAARLAGETDPWSRLVADEAAGEVAAYEAYRSHDPVRVTQVTSAANGVPDGSLLATAEEVLKDEPGYTTPGHIPTELAATIFERLLSELDLPGWRVITPEMAARMSVRGADQTIRIRPGVRFTTDELVRLVVHELGTHVFRHANAADGPALLRRPVVGYLATEEGLAAWHEERFGLTDPSVIRRYALRVIAVDTALRASFVAVVERLLPHVHVADAFEIAVRVKRGLTDTARPGAFSKDHVYLSGLTRIRDHLRTRPDDHARLMATKWPLDRIDLLRAADRDGCLAPARYTPAQSMVDLARTVLAELG